MRERAFILQATYRVESRRPVVHLYGRLESGRTFLVRDDREKPHFHVRAADAERAAKRGARPLAPTDRKTMAGEPVVRVEVPTPPEAPALRDRLQAAGVPCYEADVPFARRFLIDRGLRGSIEIEGEERSGAGVDVLFENPRLAPADWTPQLSLLSFDIETDPKGKRLLAVSLSGAGANEVLLFTPAGFDSPAGAVSFATERELLAAFCRRVRELDPDILTGWNVVDFDLTVLARMGEEFGVPFEIGRGPGGVRFRPPRGTWGSSEAHVPGRIVLDGVDLLRGAFIRMDEYSLDAVAHQVLGEGKVVAHKGLERAHEILRLFREDRALFVEYAFTDARLAREIVEKLELVELSVERSKLTGMMPDRVSASIASFDFLYLTELGKRGYVAPSVAREEPRRGSRAASQQAVAEEDAPGAFEPTTGGYVLEPEPGLYENVLVFDFKSLYPSIIRSFQIDPLGHWPDAGPEDDPITAPNGASFHREPGILPQLLDGLFPRREAARRNGNTVASHAIKILMNSFYGVLGAPSCRFHNPALANAITGFGREMLLWSKARIESYGHRVLYGDTDSLFALADGDGEEAAGGGPAARSGRADAPADGGTAVARARALGEEIARRLNDDLREHIASTWRVESRLELEFEMLYLRLFLPPVRRGSAGARKRYAGLVEENGEKTVVFTGMEVVRRDWTELAKRVQRELFARLFSDRAVEDYLHDVVAALRAGELDDQLVYRKGLRKSLAAYTATTPPHVTAARKMSERPGRLVAYVMTREGPEPAGEARSALDYEHYVQKQIRPVAESILAVLGLDFDKVVGDDRQTEMFS